MAYIDKKAAQETPDKCPMRVWTGYSSHLCGKPVKRPLSENDQTMVCGVHGAAADRVLANNQARAERWQKMREEAAEEHARDARLRALGVEHWDKAEVIRVLEQLHNTHGRNDKQ